MTLFRRIGLWAGLLALSVAVHLVLSWRAGHGLQQPVVLQETAPPVAELSLAPVEEQEPEPLFFEEPLEFEPPAILVAGASEIPPPPSVDRALQAAAGGRSEALLAAPALDSAIFTRGQGVAGFGSGIGTGLSNSANRFAAYVQGLRESGIDVVFVVDATGSMDWAIAEVRLRIADIVDAVRSLVPLARFGVVAYRDHDDPEFLTRQQPLTFSLVKLRRFLDALEARGGGSFQEAITAGLEVAARDAGWRPGAKRVVVIIGDAPPHQGNFNRLLRLTRDIASRGGQVSTLDVSNESNPALIEASLGRPVNHALYRDEPMLQYQAIADAGNGLAATMDGDVVVARQLLSLVMGGEFSREMALLMEAL
jgi:hypothetical protein